MGGEGLTDATKVAILNANYIAKRLDPHFPVLYKGKHGLVAHECIVDTRVVKGASGVEVEDIAKRLMDYGFHAPTVSFPVAGNDDDRADRERVQARAGSFLRRDDFDSRGDRMKSRREADRQDNVLKNAPHTLRAVTSNEWTHAYSREKAAFPAEWTREYKFWPAVGRVESAYGDRNLICSCPPTDAYADAVAEES